MHTGEFELTDGSKVFTRAWVPGAADTAAPQKRVAGAVLCLHGVESHSDWFEEVAAHLQANNYAVFAFDRTGWGRSPGPPGHLASYNTVVREVSEIATSLRNKYGSLHLAGLSWGGMLALYCALRRGLLFDSVTLIAPGICPTADLSLWQKLQVAGGVLLGRPERTIPLPIDVNHFTNREKRTAYIRNDPYRTKTVSASFCLETLKMRRFIEEQVDKRKTPPLQLLLAGNDAIINNSRTEALLAKAVVPPKTNTFADKAHSLVFEAPEAVSDHIREHCGTAPATATGKVAVLGAGAIGSLVGGLLALGGVPVTLIGRQQHVDAIRARGLNLKLGHGRRFIKDNLSAVTDAAEIGTQVELLLVCVKGFDTELALKEAAPAVGPDTTILTLQNGLENEGRITAVYPDNPVLAGTICAYTEFVAPGEVIWHDDRGGLAGAAVGSRRDVAEACWKQYLPATGMECPFVEGPEGATRVKWSKLLLNVAFNALNAVTGLPTHEILAHPEYGPLAVRALKEGFAVMAGKGIAPVNLPGYPVCTLARAARLPVRLLQKILAWKTGHEDSGASSMRQDLQKKRRNTEVDEINGAIVAHGRSLNIATPANERLCAMVLEEAGS